MMLHGEKAVKIKVMWFEIAAPRKVVWGLSQGLRYFGPPGSAFGIVVKMYRN